MNHAPGAGQLAPLIDLQSSALPLYYGCLVLTIYILFSRIYLPGTLPADDKYIYMEVLVIMAGILHVTVSNDGLLY